MIYDILVKFPTICQILAGNKSKIRLMPYFGRKVFCRYKRGEIELIIEGNK